MKNHNDESIVSIEGIELKTKAFVSDLLAGVNTEDSFQDNIDYIIRETGNFTRADRVCIYEAGNEKNFVEKAYQWNSGTEIAEDTGMKSIPRSEIGGWIDTLNGQQLVVVEDRESIRDKMPAGYHIMEKAGVKALLLIPVYMRGRLLASMILVNPDFTAFAVLERTFLYLGEQIGVIYHRERINHRYLLFMEGIRSSNLSEFIVDCTTKRYEAFRITKVLRNVLPEEGDWDWLRQFYASIIKPEYREEVLKRTEWEYMKRFLCTEKSTFALDIERDVNGENFWFRLEFSVVSLDEKGQLERFILLVKDITQMKQEEEEYHQMIKALSSIYNASAMIDLSKRMVLPIKFSDTARQLLPNEPVAAQTILDTFCEQMVQGDYTGIVREFLNLDTMPQRLMKTNILTCEYQGTQTEWERMNLAPVQWNKDGSLEKVVFAIQDITEQKQREEWMQYKIEHDELTGTLNRAAFNRTTKLLRDSQMAFGLLLLDIDNFKSINDTYGHDVGDEVLKRLVFVLNEKMRAVDKIFRLGGDEFAVIMNRLTLEQADYVMHNIDSVNEVTLAGQGGLPAFSISAGVTFSVTGYEEITYHNADKALYRTKETTRRGCTVFERMEDSIG